MSFKSNFGENNGAGSRSGGIEGGRGGKSADAELVGAFSKKSLLVGKTNGCSTDNVQGFVVSNKGWMLLLI